MQLVLRMERADPPSWHRALAAAATGAAAHLRSTRGASRAASGTRRSADYCRGHIRKVTRRARGRALGGRAGAPGHHRRRRRHAGARPAARPGQRAGPADQPAAGGRHRCAHRTIRRSPGPTRSRRCRSGSPPTPAMTLGKAMAQAGHAGMIAVALLADDDPPSLARVDATAGCPAVARRATGRQWAELTARSADAGRAWRRRAIARPSGTPGSPRSSRAPSPSSPGAGPGGRAGSPGSGVSPAPARAPRTDAARRCRPGPGGCRCRSAHPARRSGPSRSSRQPGNGRQLSVTLNSSSSGPERVPAQHRQDPGVGQQRDLGGHRRLQVRQRRPDLRSGAGARANTRPCTVVQVVPPLGPRPVHPRPVRPPVVALVSRFVGPVRVVDHARSRRPSRSPGCRPSP